jgi:hypothetical protein
MRIHSYLIRTNTGQTYNVNPLKRERKKQKGAQHLKYEDQTRRNHNLRTKELHSGKELSKTISSTKQELRNEMVKQNRKKRDGRSMETKEQNSTSVDLTFLIHQGKE